MKVCPQGEVYGSSFALFLSRTDPALKKRAENIYGNVCLASF
jgi:hypothetical protein